MAIETPITPNPCYGCSMNAVFRKLNYKAQQVIFAVNPPDSFRKDLEEMQGTASVRTGMAREKDVGFALAFATRKSEVDQFADWIAKVAAGDAVVWVAYPKGTSKKYKCEFNRDNGWERFGLNGFEPVRMVAIDEDWSALRFRRTENIKSLTRRTALSREGQARISKRRKSG